MASTIAFCRLLIRGIGTRNDCHFVFISEFLGFCNTLAVLLLNGQSPEL